MDEEIETLTFRGTWELVSTPTDVVSCCWVFTLKYHPDGSVNRYKDRLVANGYTQTCGNYYLRHSHRSIIVNLPWPLFQQDVKNAFFYRDL